MINKLILARNKRVRNDDEEIGEAPDGRLIVRDLKKKKIDPDDFSSDEEIGMPESIRMSDQKVAQMAAAQDGSRSGFDF